MRLTKKSVYVGLPKSILGSNCNLLHSQIENYLFQNIFVRLANILRPNSWVEVSSGLQSKPTVFKQLPFCSSCCSLGCLSSRLAWSPPWRKPAESIVRIISVWTTLCGLGVYWFWLRVGAESKISKWALDGGTPWEREGWRDREGYFGECAGLKTKSCWRKRHLALDFLLTGMNKFCCGESAK